MPQRKLSCRVLMVEDDRDISELNRLYLTPYGVKVEPVYTLGQALATLQENSLKGLTYDAVLLDLHLPDGGTPEGVIQQVRSVYNGPLILVTGYVDADFAQKIIMEKLVQDVVYKNQTMGPSLWTALKHALEMREMQRCLKTLGASITSLQERMRSVIGDYDGPA